MNRLTDGFLSKFIDWRRDTLMDERIDGLKIWIYDSIDGLDRLLDWING